MTEHEGPLDGLRQAYTAYEADPVDVRDRPSAWSALDVLLDAVRAVLAASVPDEGPDHEHHWTDAPDDEEAWHCSICGLTEYPAEPPFGSDSPEQPE